MENYRKGKNVEEPLERDKIPIPNLPVNFLWMQVRGGSKIRNLLSHALNEFPEAKHVVWTGFGTSVGKAITCAEIMKREHKNSLHQITKLCYRQFDEYWDPILPELDQIVVKRKLPMIHIYLSSEILNVAELGYQGPGTTIPFEPREDNPSKKFNNRSNTNKKFNKQNNFASSNAKGKKNQAGGSSNSESNLKNDNR